MEKNKILEELKEVFSQVFENHETPITELTTAQDIEDWDSLTNIELLVAVEKKFTIKFKSSDIQNLVNVGDLLNTIYAKTAS